MADGGNVEFVEIDGPVVYLRLAGACGSCPSSLTTMTMGIKRRLMERIPVRLPASSGLQEAANAAPRQGCRLSATLPARRPDVLPPAAAPLPLQDIMDVEQVMDENKGLELTEANIDTVLDEIRRVRGKGARGRWGVAQSAARQGCTQPGRLGCTSHRLLLRRLGSWDGNGKLRQRCVPCCSPASPTMPSADAPSCRPYLVGTGGGGLELVELDGPIAKVWGGDRGRCSAPLRFSVPFMRCDALPTPQQRLREHVLLVYCGCACHVASAGAHHRPCRQRDDGARGSDTKAAGAHPCHRCCAAGELSGQCAARWCLHLPHGCLSRSFTARNRR